MYGVARKTSIKIHLFWGNSHESLGCVLCLLFGVLGVDYMEVCMEVATEIQVGDFVRRVRGGTHQDMSEGDAGVVYEVLSANHTQIPLLKIGGFGSVGYDARNYIKVVASRIVEDFKVGDEVICVQNTSGLSTAHYESTKGAVFVVVETGTDFLAGRKFAKVQDTKGNIFDLWVKDIQLFRRRLDKTISTTFREFMKSKMAANVAVV